MVKAAPLVSIESYSELKRRVREALAKGRKRAEEAVEQEKVRTSWEVGKLIREHILLNKERAGYGQQVLKRLSADLGMSHTELRYMVEFSRANPIGPAPGQLSWAHIRELLAVNDPEKRKEISDEAVSGKWSQKELRREIKRRKAAREISVSEAPAETPLVPIKGRLDTYRIVIATAGPWKGKPAIDLGFSNYYRPKGSLPYEKNDIVQVSKTGRLTRLKDAKVTDLFTYRAYPFNITDGDTLWVLVDLGFGFVTQQHLRLRGIDAPEIESADGRQAKAFLEEALKKGPLVIRTAKSDKYDRYLADLFVEDRYLNQELIDQGLAVRVTD